MTLTALPGRIAVAVPEDPQADAFIKVPEWARRKGEMLRNDALECIKGTVVSSGIRGISEGDEVGVRADAACLSMGPTDYDFVPEGYEVRIYGVHEAVFNDEVDVVMFKVAA